MSGQKTLDNKEKRKYNRAYQTENRRFGREVLRSIGDYNNAVLHNTNEASIRIMDFLQRGSGVIPRSYNPLRDSKRSIVRDRADQRWINRVNESQNSNKELVYSPAA